MGAMSPGTVATLLFLGVLGVSLSGIYFLVEAPAARRARRSRLATVGRALVTSRERDGSAGQPAGLRRTAGQSTMLPGAGKLRLWLQQAGMETSAGAIELASGACAVVGVLAGVLTRQPSFAVPLLACGGAAVPLGFVAIKRHRRLSAFEEQFPEAIDLLGRAVRAGHAFTTGFELIAHEMPEPLAGEFRIAFEQQNLGLPLRDALLNLSRRVPSPDVKFFVSALQIQRETGGNLSEILDKLSQVIRERFKLQRQVKVFTAEGRMSLFVLTAAPIITALVLLFVNPDYVMPLVTDPTGRKMTWLAIGLLVTGFLVIRRMTHVKV